MSSDYQLLDSGHFRKLEKFGPYVLDRPAATALWNPRLPRERWEHYDARFERKGEGGSWSYRRKVLPESWIIRSDDITVNCRLTDFGHVGLFPEHHNAARLLRSIETHNREKQSRFRLLNLFAYTGYLSVLAAKYGAEIAHIDASKVSVDWARSNSDLNKEHEMAIRWIVDDVNKFIKRELRRGHLYDGIVLDPPSFGRGPKGELWKIETDLLPLLKDLRALVSPDFSFLLLSAHTPGLSPLCLANIVQDTFHDLGLVTFSEEMVIRESNKGRPLPVGAACGLWNNYDL